jgi:hypothetical protein
VSPEIKLFIALFWYAVTYGSVSQLMEPGIGWVGCEVLKMRALLMINVILKMYIILNIHFIRKEKLC